MVISKRKRVASPGESSEESESQDGSRSDSEGTGGIDEAALHTIWDVESAKKILQIIIKKPGIGVFAAIRSQWGKGLQLEKVANAHMDEMHESGYTEPSYGGGGLFDMLQGTRDFAEKLLQAGVFDAAFFFAHAAAAMIRSSEAHDVTCEDEEDIIEWVKALDTIMVGAVNGWRAQSGNGKNAKKDAATMIELLDKGERAEGYDQEKWYPQTLKALRAWAK